MANAALKYNRAVHQQYTLVYRFFGHDQGHCALINAVSLEDAERQSRRYYLRGRPCYDASLYDETGDIVSDYESLRETRPTMV